MVYHVIGLMSGSSLDGLDIVCAEFTEIAGKWTYNMICAGCLEYTPDWQKKLKEAVHCSAFDYQKLHAEYGKYLGEKVNEFIEMNNLQHKIALVASHGHTTFHHPDKGFTHQLGDGAAIAAVTSLPVVSDLRAMDVALDGEGAPIVPMGEKLLFGDFSCFLNIGGIGNISFDDNGQYIGFDVCPANRILNLLAETVHKEYDDGGRMAASGQVHSLLLNDLNALSYYSQPYPKSLSNSFGTEVVFPLVNKYLLTPEDALRTYTEHIVEQVAESIKKYGAEKRRMLVTGGGAFNTFLISRLKTVLEPLQVEVIVPEEEVVAYKEALIMALLGILRWREQDTVLASVTGAKHESIGGAVWMGR